MQKSYIQDIPKQKSRRDWTVETAGYLRANKGTWYDLAEEELAGMLIDPGVREVPSPDERARIMGAFEEFVTKFRDGSWFQVRLCGWQHQARYVQIDSSKGIKSGVVDFEGEVPDRYKPEYETANKSGWVGSHEDGHGAFPVLDGDDDGPLSVDA